MRSTESQWLSLLLGAIVASWGCSHRAVPTITMDAASDDALVYVPDHGAVSTDALSPDLRAGPKRCVDGWCSIKAETFMMGSPADEPCRFDNETQHPVSLTHAFEISATEVTQSQFETLMGYNPASFSENDPACGTYYCYCGSKSCGNNPVERVSWHEAAAYCNALSTKKGLPPCYSCTGNGSNVSCTASPAASAGKIFSCPGYRLPTEAEWEYAYRAGTSAAYYSGPGAPSLCKSCTQQDPYAGKIGWYCANAAIRTHPVGQKEPNVWGIHDMAGNVYEWCHDWYQEDLGSSATQDPWGPSGGSTRVCRGGTWYGYSRFLRAAVRASYSPELQGHLIGFRCIRSL